MAEETGANQTYNRVKQHQRNGRQRWSEKEIGQQILREDCPASVARCASLHVTGQTLLGHVKYLFLLSSEGRKSFDGQIIQRRSYRIPLMLSTCLIGLVRDSSVYYCSYIIFIVSASANQPDGCPSRWVRLCDLRVGAELVPPWAQRAAPLLFRNRHLLPQDQNSRAFSRRIIVQSRSCRSRSGTVFSSRTHDQE